MELQNIYGTTKKEATVGWALLPVSPPTGKSARATCQSLLIGLYTNTYFPPGFKITMSVFGIW